MAPVIWGLPLGDMRWSALSSSNIFRRDYHLRRAKMILYKLAMILCVLSETLGTYEMCRYINQERFIENLDRRSRVHNGDFVKIASINVFVGVFVATIFGASLFFDLFWPERQESKAVRWAWKICSVLACLLALAEALALTIVVATHQARITGVDALTGRRLLRYQGRNPPMVYRHNAKAVASAVLLWPGWLATVASTTVLFMSHAHDDKFGPKSTYTGREGQYKNGGERGEGGPPKFSKGRHDQVDGPYRAEVPRDAGTTLPMEIPTLERSAPAF